MSDPVVLINVFEVATGVEDEFVAWWQRCTETMKKEPGFIKAALHQSLDGEARFQFVTVAHWETASLFRTAQLKNKQTLATGMPAGKAHPAVYQIASHS